MLMVVLSVLAFRVLVADYCAAGLRERAEERQKGFFPDLRRIAVLSQGGRTFLVNFFERFPVGIFHSAGAGREFCGVPRNPCTTLGDCWSPTLTLRIE